MSRAREIAEERYAEGKISKEEYESIVSGLGKQGIKDADLPKASEVGSVLVRAVRNILILVGLFAAYMIFFYNGGTDKQKANKAFIVDQLKYNQDNRTVNTVFRNRSEDSGDVLFYLTQNGKSVCESVFSIKSKEDKNIQMPCEITGQYEFTYLWAEQSPERAAKAPRLR